MNKTNGSKNNQKVNSDNKKRMEGVQYTHSASLVSYFLWRMHLIY
jgi:hypothetical protein